MANIFKNKWVKYPAIAIGVAIALVIIFFEVAFFDAYLDSKFEKYQNEVPQEFLNLQPMDFQTANEDIKSYNIEITGTPQEFREYFESLVENDTITMIMITGIQKDKATKNLQWSITYTNRQPFPKVAPE